MRYAAFRSVRLCHSNFTYFFNIIEIRTLYKYNNTFTPAVFSFFSFEQDFFCNLRRIGIFCRFNSKIRCFFIVISACFQAYMICSVQLKNTILLIVENKFVSFYCIIFIKREIAFMSDSALCSVRLCYNSFNKFFKIAAVRAFHDNYNTFTSAVFSFFSLQRDIFQYTNIIYADGCLLISFCSNFYKIISVNYKLLINRLNLYEVYIASVRLA